MTKTTERPLSPATEALRAQLLAAGWRAESPAVLGADAERIAREERQS